MNIDRLEHHAPRLAWLVIVGVPALSLALGHGALQSPDGLSYLSDVRDGVDLVHPHHALYGLLLAVFGTVLAPLGVGPLAAGQVLGGATMALVLAAGWRFATAHLGRRGALLAVALLAVLRGLPLYAVRLEVYLPLMAAGAWLCVVCVEPDPHPSHRPARALAVTGLLATAALAHQMGALLAVPVLVTPWARPRVRGAAVLGAGFLALAGYGAGYLWGHPTVAAPGFVSWLVAYARAPVADWGTFAHWDLAGLAALFGNIGRMILPVPGGLGGAVAAAVAAGAGALATVARRRTRGTTAAPATRYLLVWLGVQLVFVLWWLPLDTDFAVPSLWPLWALGVLAVGRGAGRRTAAALGTAAVVLAVINLGLAMPRLARQGAAMRARTQAFDLAQPIPPDYTLEQHLRWYRGVALPPAGGKPSSP